MDRLKTYDALTPRLMLQLAAPHTWTASIFPVLLATTLAVASNPLHAVNIVMVCVLLAVSVLFQSAVNAVNDYFDFVKGADTEDNQDDPTDAVLVYNNVSPRSVLTFALILVALAFVLGIYCILEVGWIPLVIAIIGAAVLFLYSGGPVPLSYLPVGEVVSGFVMGGLITFASYYCLTFQADPIVFVWALPVMIGIALTMMTNNGCDIEKDEVAGRRTLPVLLGHERTRSLYHALIYAWVVAICAIVIVWFTAGWPILPFMLLAVHPTARALIANPLVATSRAAAFAACLSLNVALGTFYAAAVLLCVTLGS